MRALITIMFALLVGAPAFAQSVTTSADFAGHPQLASSKDVEAYVAGKGVRYVFQWHPKCPASAPAWKSMQSRPEVRALEIAVWKNDKTRPLPGTGLSDSLSSPSLTAYRDGIPVMTLYGWQAIHIDHYLPDFLARVRGGARRFHGIEAHLELSPDSFATRAYVAGTKDSAALRWLIEKQPWYPWSLEGRDFATLDFLRFKAFTGANLRGADFRGARFEDVDFSGADLTGAVFDEASLYRVFWGDAVCPDGTLSRDHGFSCGDNLILTDRNRGTGDAGPRWMTVPDDVQDGSSDDER